MPTAASLVDAIGRGQIRKRVGVTSQAITNNLAEGTFPANWYEGMKELAGEAGQQCPMGLFRMRRSPNSNQEDAA